MLECDGASACMPVHNYACMMFCGVFAWFEAVVQVGDSIRELERVRCLPPPFFSLHQM